MVARAIQSVLSERPGWTGARSGLARRELDRASQWGLWALPAWTVLLFLGTLTHQPDTRTDFAGFARYVTTTEFLMGHIVYSILGAAIGVLGILALCMFLALHARARLTLAGLILAVVGNVMITSVFGVAAFGQSAVGRLYLAGHTDEAVATYNDMYGTPLSITAAAGILSLTVGIVMLGIVIYRSVVLAKWAGVGLALGMVVFGVIGVILADFVQSIGAVMLIVSTVGVALSGRRAGAGDLGSSAAIR